MADPGDRFPPASKFKIQKTQLVGACTQNYLIKNYFFIYSCVNFEFKKDHKRSLLGIKSML